MQTAKFIDVTKTFIPTDPNTFPTSMLEGKGQTTPEDPIPVQAYEGINILPTAQGYRSYFGTTAEVGIDALTARVDFMFVFQSTTYENILVALTDTGIWTKRANVSGAWTNNIVMAAPLAGFHSDWTYVVISQVLYVYMAGTISYYKIVSNIGAGVLITDVTPNYLNMAGQIGIFRAGGRLGFWDSADVISWSNQDDYADFTPAILTLAGSAKFIDINGRIVNIVAHGPGFMIYCTKSIIYISPAPDSMFQWSPKVIFSNTGITYPRQVVAANPDTLHFAMTTAGLIRIDSLKAEVIVPEVTDSMAINKLPVYLSLMEGRYLFLESMDTNYVEGLVQFKIGSSGEATYYFPGSTTAVDAIAEEILVGGNFCSVINDESKGAYAIFPEPGDRDLAIEYTPVRTAYFSNNGNKDVSNITWGATPIATINALGADDLMNPLPSGSNLLNKLTTDSTNKIAVLGTDAYADGKWTMERFVATQQAIWNMEQQNLSNFFITLGARRKVTRAAGVFSVTPTLYYRLLIAHASLGNIPGAWYTSGGIQTQSTIDAVNALGPKGVPTIDRQLIGRYAVGFRPAKFGFSPCEFWLTRYCDFAADVYRVKKTQTVRYDNPLPAFTGTWRHCSYAIPSVSNILSFPFGGTFTSAAATIADRLAQFDASYPSLAPHTAGGLSPWSEHDKLGIASYVYTVSNNSPGSGSSGDFYIHRTWASGAVYEAVETTSYLEFVDVPITPVPDTGYCTQTGWKYTKTNGTTGFIATTTCVAPVSFPPGSTVREAPFTALVPNQAVVADDGTFCTKPFEPVVIPGLPALNVSWPATTVVLPATTFLLQDGSIAPIYPTFFGALVYDLQLKKWGKYKGKYKVLVNYSPLNNSVNGGISYQNFGILGGIVDLAGKVRLFDYYPTESYITYGKIGYSRLGMTTVEEAHVDFVGPSTGYLKVDTSVEGRAIDPTLAKAVSFTNKMSYDITGGNAGSWHNITVGSVTGGTWNINYLEFRGFTQGRR